MNAKAGFATSKQMLRYNQFGGAIGGAAIKNKLFYFFSFEDTIVPMYLTICRCTITVTFRESRKPA